MDETNNTPDVIDETSYSQIFLQPTKTSEFIVIDFNILPTGLVLNNEKKKLYIYNSNRRIKNGRSIRIQRNVLYQLRTEDEEQIHHEHRWYRLIFNKTANRPTIQFEPVTLDHINVKRKLKGKGE